MIHSQSNKAIAICFIAASVCFAIGFSMGSSVMLNKLVSAGMVMLDIELSDQGRSMLEGLPIIMAKLGEANIDKLNVTLNRAINLKQCGAENCTYIP